MRRATLSVRVGCPRLTSPSPFCTLTWAPKGGFWAGQMEDVQAAEWGGIDGPCTGSSPRALGAVSVASRLSRAWSVNCLTGPGWLNLAKICHCRGLTINIFSGEIPISDLKVEVGKSRVTEGFGSRNVGAGMAVNEKNVNGKIPREGL